MTDREEPRERPRLFTPLSSGSPVLPARRFTVVPSSSAPDRHGAVAFLSASTQSGPWLVALANRVVAVMGTATMDLREAQIPADGCDIEVFCVFGTVEIIVPPGIRVSKEAAAFAGVVELQGAELAGAAADAPVVRIRGSVYFGSVEIVVRDLGGAASTGRR